MAIPEPGPAPNPGRRRLPWLAGLGGVLVGGLIGGLVVGGLGHHRSGPELGFVPAPELIAQGYPAGLVDGDGGPPAGLPGDRHGDRQGPPGPRPWRLGPDETLVVGSVVRTGASDVTVARDGGAETTIPTNEDTTVRGAGNTEPADLDPGERVVVRVGSDGTARAIGVVQAHAMGTVTALNGDRATVRQPDGLVVQVDLSGVEPRPAPGTPVLIRGSATDQGTTLHAEEVR